MLGSSRMIRGSAAAPTLRQAYESQVGAQADAQLERAVVTSAKLVAEIEAQERQEHSSARAREVQVRSSSTPVVTGQRRFLTPVIPPSLPGKAPPMTASASLQDLPLRTWTPDESMYRHAVRVYAKRTARLPIRQPRFQDLRASQPIARRGHAVRPHTQQAPAASAVPHAWKAKSTQMGVRCTATRGFTHDVCGRPLEILSVGVSILLSADYENAVTRARVWECPDDLLPPLTPVGASTTTASASLLQHATDGGEGAPDWGGFLQDHVHLDIANDPNFYMPTTAYRMCRKYERSSSPAPRLLFLSHPLANLHPSRGRSP
jgi:hypothetical protein